MPDSERLAVSAIKVPIFPVVENKEVDEATEEKKLVEVEFVEVELPVIVKLASMVEEAVERKPLRKPRRVEVETP